MAQLSARGAALAALGAWRIQKRFADSIISDVLAEGTLSAADRAFALELFYGVLRNLTLLDFWVGCLRTAPVDFDLRDILRLGLYQLLLLGTPEHAAVYESVELAPSKGRGLINGILRTAVRNQERLRSQADSQPLSIRTSHPEFLITQWEGNFGVEAAAALCAWNNRPPRLYARINRLRIDNEEFALIYPDSQPLAHNPGFVEFDAFPTKALEHGHCYIQDPSTAIASQLLDPQPGEKILDACAAPGGKTSYLAELMQNRGIILACDRESERIRLLEENAARLGIEIVQVSCHDWRKSRIPKKIEAIGPFDRILIDAPCTNTGVMQRRVDVRWRLQPTDFVRMQKQQLEIVRAVSRLLRPGGHLVYSTCSLEPQENQELVEQLLVEISGMRLLEKKYCRPFRDSFDGVFAAKLAVAPHPK